MLRSKVEHVLGERAAEFIVGYAEREFHSAREILAEGRTVEKAHELSDNAGGFATSLVQNEIACNELPVACTSGCNACCHYFVEAGGVEVLRIADWIRDLPQHVQTGIRERIDEAINRGVGQLSVSERLATRIPCPLLDPVTGACLVYAVRPIGCRQFFSHDPRDCEAPSGWSLFLGTMARGGAVRIGLDAGLYDAGLESESVELVSGLARALDEPDATERWVSGQRILQAGLDGAIALRTGGGESLEPVSRPAP